MTPNRPRVGVLFGGRSGEHKVSLVSGRSVLDAINRERWDVVPMGIAPDGQWIVGEGAWEFLSQQADDTTAARVALGGSPGAGFVVLSGQAKGEFLASVDCILPVTHGTYGEDGALQGLLEMADVPYVGAGVVGSAVCMDKAIFKAVCAHAGLPLLPWLLVRRHELQAGTEACCDRIEQSLHYPVFVKPANLGSSVGISRAASRDELAGALLEAARWDRRIVVEQGLEGPREVEVAVLGNEHPQASLAGEIVPDREFYDFDAKYAGSDSKLLIPSPLSEEEHAHIRQMAVLGYLATDCAGLARVDFLGDPQTGAWWLNEINTLPGFTSISMYPKLWDATGVPYTDLIDRLIELALERFADTRSNETVAEKGPVSA